jgi:hypothetical protein
MKRRDFLARTAAGVSASLLLANVPSDGYRFVGSALAAGEGDRQKATLEQKFAELPSPSSMKPCPRTLSPRPSGCFSIRSDAHSDPWEASPQI